jgi:hypothetical protein
MDSLDDENYWENLTTKKKEKLLKFEKQINNENLDPYLIFKKNLKNN